MRIRVIFNAGCRALLAAVFLMSGNAWAEVLVRASNAATPGTAVSDQPAKFEVIPEDPVAAKLKFSDKTKTYKKTFYLRGYFLSGDRWMDEHRYLATMYAGDGFEAKFGEIPPKVVMVDTLTGKVEDTGIVGDLTCYSEGRIATSIQDIHGDLTMYFGKLNEPLQAYPKNFPQGMELNNESCQLIPAWKYPKDKMGGDLRLLRRFPLKVGHGAIFERQSTNSPELKISQDEHGLTRFYRAGPVEMPPRHVYWEQPTGKHIDIPFNPGEQISNVLYLPYEKAYLIRVDLSGTQPFEVALPRFERLLYLDGTVKRFGVPSVIMDLVQARKVSGGVKYSKKGFEWSAHWNTREPNNQHIGGLYEVMNGELVKIEPVVGWAGPDGCKEYGQEKQLFSKHYNFFYIDICKSE